MMVDVPAFGLRKRLAAFIAAMVALVLLSACSTAGPSPNSGNDLVTESDEPEARTRARRHLTLAVLYFNDGKTTVALDALKQSIAADPNWSESFNLRGLIYMRLNDASLAEDSFRKALQLDPKSAAVQHNYGRLLCKQSRLGEAVALFSNALGNSAYQEKAKTWMVQGECQSEAGQKDAALNSFLRSYELDPVNPFTGYNIALLLYQRGDYAQAQFYARRLNNGTNANAESFWLGLRVERKLGQKDAVDQLSTQLRKRFPLAKETNLLDRGKFDD
jgi:type IV pilus assembly protein PilF